MVMALMKTLKSILLVGAVLATSLCMARPEPNAFLNKPAWTHGELMTQLRGDSQVMSRMMRHFGMTREEILAMAQTLRAGALDRDGVYLVYNCHEDEVIRARVIFYKKGTKVWEDASGKPILKMSCANPMVRGTDDQQILQTQNPGSPVTETRPIVPQPEPPAPSEVEAAILPSQVEPSPIAAPAAMLPAAAVASIPAAAVTSAGAGFNPLFLAPLAGLGLIRGGSSGGTGGTTGDVPHPDPIPEPGTMLALGVGAAIYGARRRAKKNS